MRLFQHPLQSLKQATIGKLGPPPTLNPKCRRTPFRGNGREQVMRRVLMTAALTMAAMGVSAPAYAAVTLTSYNGPDLDTHIKASTTDTQNDQAQVFGCT